eukprot:GHVU01086118.1.p1 GENE.GHVU01086118.1~~GHVU01086118.1.p1  ORF type:complete len:289 (-),score=52.50 GHVU01086118.1:224-1090(-)
MASCCGRVLLLLAAVHGSLLSTSVAADRGLSSSPTDLLDVQLEYSLLGGTVPISAAEEWHPLGAVRLQALDEADVDPHASGVSGKLLPAEGVFRELGELAQQQPRLGDVTIRVRAALPMTTAAGEDGTPTHITTSAALDERLLSRDGEGHPSFSPSFDLMLADTMRAANAGGAAVTPFAILLRGRDPHAEETAAKGEQVRVRSRTYAEGIVSRFGWGGGGGRPSSHQPGGDPQAMMGSPEEHPQEAPQKSLLQRYWWLIPIALVGFSLMSADQPGGPQSPQHSAAATE